MAISPGVNVNITQITSYVEGVPSTIGLVCSLTPKGEDNKLKFYSSKQSYFSECGEPNINTYGKSFSQGQYIAGNYLGESSALYHMRCLPDDASFSNIRLYASLASEDSTATILVDYLQNQNTLYELRTNLESVGTNYPICIFYPIGRGVYYNGIGIRITEYANPMYQGVYNLDIYEKQSDGDDVIIESFMISFNPSATDISGNSLFIEEVLNKFSSILRVLMTTSDGEYTSGYNLVSKIYDNDVGIVSVDTTAVSAYLMDDRQNFGDWEDSDETGTATYCVEINDGNGNIIYGWLGTASGTGKILVNIFDGRDFTTNSRGWVGNTSEFNYNSSNITYVVKKSYSSIQEPFISSSDPIALKYGTDGSLLDAQGDIDPTVATQTLAKAFAGTLIDPKKDADSPYADDILNTDDFYFSVIFDAGYPTSVKDAIYTLAITRRDAHAFLDNGDNANYSASISARQNNQNYNTYFVSLYESYNKVYDIYTGKDIWVSPIYHMAYLVPRNDIISQPWFAVANFDRADIGTIKELRFSPKKSERDQMYLKKINPIVQFSQGFTPFSQLTTQAKPGPNTDVNIVRCVLYCARALKLYCDNYIFTGQNDQITWSAVENDILKFLYTVKRDRGLETYSVEVGATDYDKQLKKFHVNVFLTPIRAVEQIDLNFYIK